MVHPAKELQQFAGANDPFDLSVREFLFGFFEKLGGPKRAGEKLAEDYESLPPGQAVRVQAMKTALMYTNQMAPDTAAEDELIDDEMLETELRDAVKRAH